MMLSNLVMSEFDEFCLEGSALEGSMFGSVFLFQTYFKFGEFFAVFCTVFFWFGLVWFGALRSAFCNTRAN